MMGAMNWEASRRWCPWCTGERVPIAGACERCGSPHCGACALGACPGCDVLARMHAALRGEPVRWSPPVLTSEADRALWSMIDAAGAARVDEKLLYILRSFGERGRDILMAPHVVQMRALGDRGRHAYRPWGAPHVLNELMRAMEVELVERPLVGLARGGRVWKVVGRDVRDELVWIVPAADHVELRLRPVQGVPPPRPIPIPAEGPLALPPPCAAPSSPRHPHVFVESDPPGIPCPHCGLHATRHRALGAALVCSGCSGSFDRDAHG